jgi:hypothetical protein
VRTVEGFPGHWPEVGEGRYNSTQDDAGGRAATSSRRGAVAARRAHNPKVAGSNPAAATKACVARAVVPPRPIPNRVVKRRSADATGA